MSPGRSNPGRGVRNGRAARVAEWLRTQTHPRTAREVLEAIRPAEPRATIDAVCATLAALAERDVAVRVGVLSGQTRWAHAQANAAPAAKAVGTKLRMRATPQRTNFLAPAATVDAPDPKAALRAQLERDLRAFKRAGGKVEVLTNGASSQPLKHAPVGTPAVPVHARLFFQTQD